MIHGFSALSNHNCKVCGTYEGHASQIYVRLLPEGIVISSPYDTCYNCMQWLTLILDDKRPNWGFDIAERCW